MRCTCGHTASLHVVHLRICLGTDSEGGGCSCTQFRLAADAPSVAGGEMAAPPELLARVEAFRAMLKDSIARGITPDEYLAIVELTAAVGALLGDEDDL